MISHQIRSEKAKEIKGGETHTHTHLPVCLFFFFFLCPQERTLHLIWAAWGIAALPEPPFWKHPVEQRVTGENSLGGEGERAAGREREKKANAGVYPHEVS